MPGNNELVNMLRAVIQEEIKPVRQELQQVNTRLDTMEAGQTELRNEVQDLRVGQTELRNEVQDLRAGQHGINKRLATLETDQQELKKGQVAIEAAVNDLRTINRRAHKELFSQLNAIWDDIKLLSSRGEKAIR